MAIKAVTGLPGHGKTLDAMHLIIKELVYTGRQVVTNIEEIKRKELNVYLQKKYPDVVVDLDARLLIIPKQETFRFYRYRAGGLVLPEVEVISKESRESFLLRIQDYFKKVGEKPEWMVPVTYFLDEAHEYFNARDWVDIGRPILYYISKHRHLFDEIVLITQAPQMLESTFKRLVQEETKVTNQYKMTFGPFKRPGCFLLETYYGIRAGTQTPFETTKVKLDLEVASCYETTGALGIRGRGAETESHKKRRMPWWMIWVFGAVAAVGLSLALWYVPRLITGYFTSFLGATTKQINAKFAAPEGKKVESGVVAPAKTVESAVHAEMRPFDAASSLVVKDVRPKVVGYVVRGGMANVVLDDGTVVTEMDEKPVTRIDRVSVVVDGKRLYMVTPKPSERRVVMAEGAKPVPAPEVKAAEETEDDGKSTWLPMDKEGVHRLRHPVTLKSVTQTEVGAD